MDDKRKIEALDMYKDGLSSLDSTLEALNEIYGDEFSDAEKRVKMTKKDFVSYIVSEAIATMDIKKIHKIMTDMKWEYIHGGLVTIDMIKEHITEISEHAVSLMLDNNEQFTTVSSGGFEAVCRLCDETCVELEINFVPYTGYGYGNTEDIID